MSLICDLNWISIMHLIWIQILSSQWEFHSFIGIQNCGLNLTWSTSYLNLKLTLTALNSCSHLSSQWELIVETTVVNLQLNLNYAFNLYWISILWSKLNLMFCAFSLKLHLQQFETDKVHLRQANGRWSWLTCKLANRKHDVNERWGWAGVSCSVCR